LTDEWVFSREFEPRLKPNEYVLINNQYYQVVETRPMFPFYLVLTNVTAQQTLDLRDYGLKADTNQLLNYRLKINGPAQLLIGVQGLAGYNYGAGEPSTGTLTRPRQSTCLSSSSWAGTWAGWQYR